MKLQTPYGPGMSRSYIPINIFGYCDVLIKNFDMATGCFRLVLKMKINAKERLFYMLLLQTSGCVFLGNIHTLLGTQNTPTLPPSEFPNF